MKKRKDVMKKKENEVASKLKVLQVNKHLSSLCEFKLHIGRKQSIQS